MLHVCLVFACDSSPEARHLVLELGAIDFIGKPHRILPLLPLTAAILRSSVGACRMKLKGSTTS